MLSCHQLCRSNCLVIWTASKKGVTKVAEPLRNPFFRDFPLPGEGKGVGVWVITRIEFTNFDKV